MSQKDQRTSATSIPGVNPADLAAMGKQQVGAMMDVQKQLLQAVEEVNREWAARVKAETEFAAEFAGKLSAAQSIPETTAVCQEWMSRRMEMFAADSRRFVAETQKFMATAGRLMPKGWPGGST
jgi:Phasin protein